MPHLPAILTLLVSLAACAGYGVLWLRLLGRAVGRDPLQLVYAVALGMGTLAYLILAAGLLGWLSPGVLIALVALGLITGVASRGRPFADHEPQPNPTPDPQPPTPAERWLTLAVTAFVGLLALATLPSALRPVDGLDWDSLSYHLAAPKIYLHEGRIFHIAYDSHTNFPFTMEMLYTLGLAFGGMGGAKLFHWAAGWLTAAAIGVYTSRLEIGGRRVPGWAGPLAAGTFASMPVVLWEMGTAYVDLGTALFQFLALAALLDAIRFRDGGAAARWEGAALAGALSGFALGTKYTALIQFGLLGLLLLWVVVRAGGKERAAALKATFGFGALGLLVASPWYVKNWLWVHNPVYPFYYSLFPNSFSWTKHFEVAYYHEQKGFGLGRGLPEFLKVFWNLGMNGRAFFIAGANPVGDSVGSLGPIWAGLLPLALWARGLGWRVWAMLAYSLASIGIWFLLSHQSRYLMPVFAPLAVVAAAILAALPTRLLRIAGGAFTGLAFALSLVLHAPLAVESTLVATGQRTEQEFLRASLGSLNQAVGFVNGLPEDSRVALYDEPRGFYFDRDYFWANPGQHNMIQYDRLQNGDALADALRRFRITHVLVNFAYFAPGSGHTETDWYRLLRDAIQRGHLEEVFRTDRAEMERRGIIVYELK